MIVEHSIARHQSQRQLCLSTAQQLQALLAEREELLAEVNQWRSASGAPLPPKEARPVGQKLKELFQIEREAFGAFPNGFGENVPEEGSGDDHSREEPSLNVAEGSHTLSGIELPPQDALLRTDSHPNAVQSSDDVDRILEHPATSLDPQTSHPFAMEGIFDASGPVDYSSFLADELVPNIITNPTNVLEAAQQIPVHGDPSLEITFPHEVQDDMQFQMSNEAGIPNAPFTHAFYESFNNMHQSFQPRTINRQHSFPT